MAARAVPPLHVVTDDAVFAGDAFLARAAAVIAAGSARLAFHLRAPGTGGRRLYQLGRALAPLTRAAGAALLVNDRVDVALACAADGAQVGARGLAAVDARALLGPERLLGASVHSRAAAEDASGGGADFLLAGTIYASASHPARPGVGPAFLRELSAIGTPLVAIGGVDATRVREVRDAGAQGVAVLRAVWAAPDAAAAVHQLLEAWEER